MPAMPRAADRLQHRRTVLGPHHKLAQRPDSEIAPFGGMRRKAASAQSGGLLGLNDGIEESLKVKLARANR
jgi:hypothetical protein